LEVAVTIKTGSKKSYSSVLQTDCMVREMNWLKRYKFWKRNSHLCRRAMVV
jgi:hypothetical protein